MRFEIVKQVFLKELRETLRDRRSLAVMFGIPLLLYPLLTMSMAGLATSTRQRMTEQVSRVAVINAEAAPHLLARMKRPKSGFHLISPRDPRGALAAKQIDAILVVPKEGEAGALAAREVEFRIQIDRSRTAAPFAQRKLEELLDEYERWIVGERLKARGVPVSLVRPLRTTTDDVATGDKRLGSMLAMMLPMMLLLTGMFGAFFPAINATTTERELGTLESLLVTPAGKLELLVGKVGLVLISGLLTAGLNMLSMSLVLWRFFSATAHGREAFTIDPGALALTYLAVVPTILFTAAAVLVVGLFARNFKEANSYSTPVMLLSLVPSLVSIAEPKVTPGLLVTPIVNTTLIIREVLTDHATLGAFLLAFVSSTLYAGLMLSLAARLFTSEQLVNPAWEPLSLKGLRRGSRKGEGRLPAVDEALTLVAISILLVFYTNPSWVKAGLLLLLAGNEILLVAAPTLLFAWLGRYRWMETFSWRRPRAATLLGAPLLALGALPWFSAWVAVQNRFWPPDPAALRAAEKLFGTALEQHGVLAIVAVGVLAGVCEELLYRGPLQTALTRHLPTGFALATGGFLFAAAHMDAHGLISRGLLGILLGWIVLSGGSIFPAMLAHGVFDMAALALGHWAPKGSLLDLELLARLGQGGSGTWMVQLAGGAVLMLIGWRLCAGSAKTSP